MLFFSLFPFFSISCNVVDFEMKRFIILSFYFGLVASFQITVNVSCSLMLPTRVWKQNNANELNTVYILAGNIRIARVFIRFWCTPTATALWMLAVCTTRFPPKNKNDKNNEEKHREREESHQISCIIYPPNTANFYAHSVRTAHCTSVGWLAYMKRLKAYEQ